MFTILAEEEQKCMRTKQDSLGGTKSKIKASGKVINNTASGQGSHDNQTPPEADADIVTSTKRRKFAAMVEDSDEDDITSPTQKKKLQKVFFFLKKFGKTV